MIGRWQLLERAGFEGSLLILRIGPLRQQTLSEDFNRSTEFRILTRFAMGMELDEELWISLAVRGLSIILLLS